MANGDGVQDKLDRVRPPKVQIKMEPATAGAYPNDELPFMMAILADLSNKPIEDEEGDVIPVKNRKFKEIDRDNFAEIMTSTAPEANVRVDNKLDDSGGKVGAKLIFRKMDDFRPENIAEQVPALKPLLETRRMIQECLDRIDGNDKFEKLLNTIVERAMNATGPTTGSDSSGQEG